MTMTMTYHLDIFINAKCPTRVKVCGLMSYGVSVRRLTSYGLNVLLCSGATPYRRLMSYIGRHVVWNPSCPNVTVETVTVDTDRPTVLFPLYLFVHEATP